MASRKLTVQHCWFFLYICFKNHSRIAERGGNVHTFEPIPYSSTPSSRSSCMFSSTADNNAFLSSLKGLNIGKVLCMAKAWSIHNKRLCLFALATPMGVEVSHAWQLQVKPYRSNFEWRRARSRRILMYVVKISSPAAIFLIAWTVSRPMESFQQWWTLGRHE